MKIKEYPIDAWLEEIHRVMAESGVSRRSEVPSFDQEKRRFSKHSVLECGDSLVRGSRPVPTSFGETGIDLEAFRPLHHGMIFYARLSNGAVNEWGDRWDILQMIGDWTYAVMGEKDTRETQEFSNDYDCAQLVGFLPNHGLHVDQAPTRIDVEFEDHCEWKEKVADLNKFYGVEHPIDVRPMTNDEWVALKEKVWRKQNG